MSPVIVSIQIPEQSLVDSAHAEREFDATRQELLSYVANAAPAWRRELDSVPYESIAKRIHHEQLAIAREKISTLEALAEELTGSPSSGEDLAAKTRSAANDAAKAVQTYLTRAYSDSVTVSHVVNGSILPLRASGGAALTALSYSLGGLPGAIVVGLQAVVLTAATAYSPQVK